MSLISILARIGFKQQIQDYAYKSQSKVYKDRMEFAFVDGEGRQYFYFPNLDHMPLCRLEVLNTLQDNLRSRIPGKDLDLWISKCEEVLNSNSQTKITDFGYWIGALKHRREVLFDPTILMEIASLLYIREDENPGIYIKEIHREKFQLFWNEMKEGGRMYDFFQQAGLRDYIPSSVGSAISFQESLEKITLKMEEFNTAVTLISTQRSEADKLLSSSMKT